MREIYPLQERPRFTIAIIGGGFTGAMLTVQLLRKAGEGVSVVLVERRSEPGRGVAYGTAFEGHLLNVRAHNMSAYPDAPDHFVRWAQRNYRASVKPDDFLPRAVYGQYVASQFRQATESHPRQFRYIRNEAVGLIQTGSFAEVHLAGGEKIIADKAVLALGHFPPGDLALPGKTADCPRFISNPWSPEATRHANQDNSVLLVGSGLTSVDVAVELRARGFKGVIHILSRRGLLPQSHKPTGPFPPFQSDGCPLTALELLQLIRLHVRAAEGRGSDWRQVIDSLRPVTQQLWRNLPLAEQKRFLRHLRPYWDAHRHRIAEAIADQLTAERESGQIQMHAGRITEYREDAEGVDICYRERNSGKSAKLRVDRVVNCTGPDSDYRRVGSPLLSDLMNKGLARPDQLSLGLDSADDGALLDARGVPSDVLYTLGPLRKGGLWESIAVPELRVQVADLARHLLIGHRAEDEAVRFALGSERSPVPYV